VSMLDSPIGFFEFGMDRECPFWVPMKGDLPVFHLGPGKKGGINLGGSGGTIDLEWPDYDFDSDEPLWPLEHFAGGLVSSFAGKAADGTIGGVVATHVLEHLKDPRPLIWEVARVLAPGAPFNIVVPKAGSNLFWQDLDHKSGFVLDTWKTLLDNSYYSKGKSRKWSSVLEIGFNAEMAIKEGNVAIVTQLIKVG
jgi:SAM-dependent methyltransferase